MKSRILFADNDIDFLDTRAEFLESAGYEVLKASTPAQAVQLLGDMYIHLAILDTRLVNDADDKDVSGLTLAKASAYQTVPKIILTDHTTVQAVKEAMHPALEGLPPAVDFIAKVDGPQAMIEAVNQTFARFVRVNSNLVIRWDSREPLSFPHLTNLIRPGLPSQLLLQWANELEDLVRKLYFPFQQVQLGRLLWSNNLRFCIPVITRSREAATDLRILVCGDRDTLRQERTNIGKFAPDIVLGTELRDQVETMHFGANIYSLSGANIETVQTLRDLFQVGRERQLKVAITHLLEDVLKAWHQHGHRIVESGDLMTEYRKLVGLVEESIPQTEVEQRIESLIRLLHTLEGVEIRRSEGCMDFGLTPQHTKRFPEPVATIYSPLTQFSAAVISRISPGQLTPDNILVDTRQNVWLSDFDFAGLVPQWWDFINLEAAIRFDLSQAPDLLTWQEFEEHLVKPGRLDERLEQNEVIPELRTSVALIEQVRRQAASETSIEPLPYYAGLFIWAMNALVRYEPEAFYTQAERLRAAHLLLASAMIAERLGVVDSQTQPTGSLRLEAGGRVWLGTRLVAVLVGFRLKILECLYEQPGQTLSIQTIIENAYGEKYDFENQSQRQRVRQEVRRLREEIEPDPQRPKYILTDRERGYRLLLSGTELRNE